MCHYTCHVCEHLPEHAQQGARPDQRAQVQVSCVLLQVVPVPVSRTRKRRLRELVCARARFERLPRH